VLKVGKMKILLFLLLLVMVASVSASSSMIQEGKTTNPFRTLNDEMITIDQLNITTPLNNGDGYILGLPIVLDGSCLEQYAILYAPSLDNQVSGILPVYRFCRSDSRGLTGYFAIGDRVHITDIWGVWNMEKVETG